MEFGDLIDPSLAILTTALDPSEWTTYEDTQLSNIVHQIGPYAWHETARLLATGRTAHECEIRWRTVLSVSHQQPQHQQQHHQHQQQQQQQYHHHHQHQQQPQHHHQQPQQFHQQHQPQYNHYVHRPGDIPVSGYPSDDILVAPPTNYYDPYGLPANSIPNQYTSQQPRSALIPVASSSTLHSAASSSNVAPRPWSAEEDARLLSIVATHGAKDWNNLAILFGGDRSGASCCARHARLVANDGHHIQSPSADALGKSKTWSKWTDEEDRRLRQMISTNGASNWSVIARGVGGGRTDDSCRGRWEHLLSLANVNAQIYGAGSVPNALPTTPAGANVVGGAAASPAASNEGDAVKGAKWTSEEDDRMTKLRLENPNWSWRELGREMGRTGGSVRARWAVKVSKGEIEQPKRESTVTTTTSTAPASPAATATTPAATTSNAGAEPLRQGRAQSSTSDDSEQSRPQTATPGSGDGKDKAFDGGPRPAARPWNKIEDDELRALIKKYGRNNWKRIGDEMSTPRTATSVSSRWYKHLQAMPESGAEGSTSSTSGQKAWTEAEDEELTRLVQQYGTSESSWIVIGETFSGDRSSEACRARWNEKALGSNGKADPNGSTAEASTATASSDVAQSLQLLIDPNLAIDPALTADPNLASFTSSFDPNAPLDLEALIGSIQNEIVPDEAALNLMILESLQSGVGGDEQQQQQQSDGGGAAERGAEDGEGPRKKRKVDGE